MKYVFMKISCSWGD